MEKRTEKEKGKLVEIRDNLEYNHCIREDIRKRIVKLNDDLSVRQESIDLLKGRLKDQIRSFKEMIAKVLDKDVSLAEKIRTLFSEQGITIASILRATGMATRVLVEALLSGGGGGAPGDEAYKPLPKDEKGLKEWIRNKLAALASLPGRFGAKVAAALSGSIGAILSWILNKAADVVGWVSQNLWALIVGIGGLFYTYGYEKVKIILQHIII